MKYSVYMITDRQGALMYIGSTKDIYRRQAHHRANSPWFARSRMIHHKAYEDRAYARRVEARAIRIYRPPHNKRDNPDWDQPVNSDRISKRTKAAMAAGRKFGRRKAILDHPKRLAYLQTLYDAGDLIDGDGQLLISREALMTGLNKADRKALAIKNTMTIKRWQDDGYPGLERKGKGAVGDADDN